MPTVIPATRVILAHARTQRKAKHTIVIPAKAGIQRGRATGSRSRSRPKSQAITTVIPADAGIQRKAKHAAPSPVDPQTFETTFSPLARSAGVG